jgi:hypothetical protein
MRESKIFLMQVSKPGSINVLKNGRYVNSRWQSKPRDRDHGKVRPGDLVLMYFAYGSIDFKRQLRRIYRVADVSEGNFEFTFKLEKEINPLTYKQILRYVKEGILSENMKNCGQQGFNIKEISREDYERVLEIADKTPRISKKEDRMTHGEAEGLLLRLGNMLGFDTYTPDKAPKTKEGEELGNLCTLKEIPQFTYPEILNTVKQIDVIWFKNKYPKYCFEVEHTTDITKGLLRLYHLKELNASLFIVAPSSKRSKFEFEIRKDPFNQMKERYIFRTYTQLLELYDCAQKFIPIKGKFGIQ